MAFLSLNDQSSKTAACYITAINFRCKLYQNVDISHNFIAKKMLQGMKRSKRSKDVAKIFVEATSDMSLCCSPVCKSTSMFLLGQFLKKITM
jgi:hypothetical protein